jgi:alkylation response protein AidB-like acyl-CoA dehydrogenase
VSLDLAFDDAQQAIVDGIAQFCRDRCPDDVVKQATGKFPAEPALEALGAAVFPGPLPATFFATQVLPEADRVAVARGDAVASVGVPPLMPWAPAAHLFLALERGRVWKGSPRGEIEPVETLGGEPWGRLELERESDLGPADRARVIYEIALAAYLAAAGRRLVDDTAEHARTRKQFGRAIGEFQAVAHPLADCSIQLGGAATLARAAAFRFDDRGAARRGPRFSGDGPDRPPALRRHRHHAGRPGVPRLEADPPARVPASRRRRGARRPAGGLRPVEEPP